MNQKPRSSARILNALIFQVGWFSCVLGAASQRIEPALAAAVVAAAIAIAEDKHRGRALALIGFSGLLGLGIDGMNLAFDLVRPAFGGVRVLDSWLFIAALWINFGTTLRSSLTFLGARLPLAALFGLIGAPLAYFAGERLGAVQLGPWALSIIAGQWALATPLLVLLARNGRSS